MASSPVECSSCGETDDLRGAPEAGDIRITCGSCGAHWLRGGPRCATCGGGDLVERPQAMTRHSRGTQLSIIGWQQVPLCRVCDAAALRTSIADNVPLPHTYVAAALRDASPDTRPPATGPARPADAPARPGPRTRSAPAEPQPAPPSKTPKTPQAAQAAQAAQPPAAGATGATRPTGGGATRQPGGPPARRPGTRPPAGAVPTVRQAIQAFLTESSGDVDHTALLLLGTHLGSASRLSVLEERQAAADLATWAADRWPDRQAAARSRALDTLCRAVDFWGARGWLASDPAAHLRPD
ncbi:hypothetical protein QNO07_10260 [Streptomyces sp. 549]|uniref:hypothetical protein n=1 Tax=Streptomyces sp. 549 TaxID=3049076 RepID=UPI0024C326F4|nr:hypothetical protein [Streptomyces sp. 549]MDK1473798.1 hypothetical protein [Streptomyces sp. 549]